MMDGNRLEALLHTRSHNHPLPRAFYVDPEIYEADLELIFHRDWIFAGHTFELERKGSYLTLQLGHYPIVVVRGADGEIRAFHNVCRHRGAQVCSHAKGVAAKLVCPYHRWVYDLDGQLRFARNMGDSFRVQDYRLKRVACATVGSYVFVCIASDPPDFDEFRQSVSPYLLPHVLDNGKVAYETHLVEEGNWKVVFENNRECYHCDANHPELMRTFVENRSVAGLDTTDQDSDVTAHWAFCERAGFKSTMHLAPSGQYRMTRVPLKPGTSSYTMSGEPAVGKPLGSSAGHDLGVLLMFHYPSTWNHVLGDHAVSTRVLPMGVGKTLVTTKWIVPKDAVEGEDYDLNDLTRVWTMTNEQDRQLVQGAYQGIQSPAFEPGPFSENLEAGPNQFVNWYCDHLTTQLGTPMPTLRAVHG